MSCEDTLNNNKSDYDNEGKELDIRPSHSIIKATVTSAPNLQFINDIHSDFVYIRYTHVENIGKDTKEMLTDNTRDCLNLILNKLIVKEKEFLYKLTKLITQMRILSTTACQKIDLLENIQNFHAKAFLKNFCKCADSTQIPKIFKKHGKGLHMHAIFASSRKDFSYLVTDHCDTIIDHFRERLLEYNFSISQIKNVCFNNLEIRMDSTTAEDLVKAIFYKINLGVRNSEIT